MPLHRVTIATDVPFWRRATGAQQRIASLARMFGSDPFETSIFYLGIRDADTLATAEARGLKRERFHSLQQPGFFEAVRQKLGWGQLKSSPVGSTRVNRTLTLDDYRWPNAIQEFELHLKQQRPQTVVLEYVTMAYLAPSVRRVIPDACLILDSHDILHRRCAQFLAAGHAHWLNITAPQEIDAVQHFDVILAIQDEEAAWFREIAPRARVFSVGHSFDFTEIHPEWRSESQNSAVVGYLGSCNGSNVDAVDTFVTKAWPRIVAESASPVELLVAGTVADSPRAVSWRSAPGVRVERDLNSPAEFYRRVDFVVNPVRFGTGLKIKSVESLAYGRPLVTTRSGRVGIGDSFGSACIAVQEIEEMVDPILKWVANRSRLGELSRWAHSQARTAFSSEAVLGELRQFLLGWSRGNGANQPFPAPKNA